jgi:hypothetical protein
MEMGDQPVSSWSSGLCSCFDDLSSCRHPLRNICIACTSLQFLVSFDGGFSVPPQAATVYMEATPPNRTTTALGVASATGSSAIVVSAHVSSPPPPHQAVHGNTGTIFVLAFWYPYVKRPLERSILNRAVLRSHLSAQTESPATKAWTGRQAVRGLLRPLLLRPFEPVSGIPGVQGKRKGGYVVTAEGNGWSTTLSSAPSRPHLRT